ncbi:helix-turn-helix transcriptional regulator [Streptomyces capoamus]|uniref:Helix-turn-helix transcriptional regulator n=1 Tax=Streptomyces capoamus TaxID=68183 RepID=A0A919C587_9ACTN|nr:helix-turn-helix transcriptional regulator [Streptomyces capoamus]GGW10433.1 helix-turn-helix transcriptional regulator [Streptomyces libani subsp. rufus]GHG51782.1 helix-turn-helix transcriptional regulator [Streptomyces capoamus]
MTIYEPDAGTPEAPWPFTGRDGELDLVRGALTAGRPGIVVTGPAGRGKTRLITEAVRGTDHARVTGTPEARDLPLAAFAHLLPDTVSLHRAVRALSGVRLLVVDDAQLLDETSAALVHQLAVQGRTRLVVAAADGPPAPAAVSRLWTGELLPRLPLGPLSPEDTARLLAGTGLEPLTVRRLYQACRGDLRLLRDLVTALAGSGRLTSDPDTGERAWRGPLPVTPAVRERLAPALERPGPGERDALERLAFAEPVPLPVDELDLAALERLEADGLVDVDEQGAVTLAHPLHGPALRAAAGRLRARRLGRPPFAHGPALAAEQRVLTRRMERYDVRAVPTPVGEWLVAQGGPLPAGYAAVRARFARLRGELREAAAWAREGLRETGSDDRCLTELALAEQPLGEVTDPDAVHALYGRVRLGEPGRALGRLPAGSVFARHAEALARGDGAALDRAAQALSERGFLLYAAEAHAQAARVHRDPRAARLSRTRAVALARRCQGAGTPALAGLVLGELTARQREIVTLAAAGLSNREIAERLTLSVRTVGNHLYGAYARLGTGDRRALPWLVDAPERETA